MKGSAIVLLSGGQDSTTALFWAVKKFRRVETVSFNYGQRHAIELKSAAVIAGLAGVKNTIIKIKEYEVIKNSALLDKHKILNLKHKMNNELPSTFVPGRNILFLTVAASLAYTKDIRNIVIGVSQVDYSGYPDCRRPFINSMEKSLSFGMEYKFKIHTPLINRTKKETVLLAKKFGALGIMKYTYTCYKGGKKPCNRCAACILRAKGFKEAGIKDPMMQG